MGCYPTLILISSPERSPGQSKRWKGPWRAGPGLRSGEEFAQGQMGGEKEGEPQHAKPKDDIKVLVDPALRLPVIEAVNIIDVDGEI